MSGELDATPVSEIQGGSTDGVYCGPLQPVWLMERQVPPGAMPDPRQCPWEPLWKADTVRLEESMRRSKGDSEPVPVQGGLYAVDVAARTIAPCYWKEEPQLRKVIRATWFRKTSKGWLSPYSEADSANLEALFQKAPRDLQNAEEVSLQLSDGENKVVMKRRSSWDLVTSPTGGMMEPDGSPPAVVSMTHMLSGSLLEVLKKNPLFPTREVMREYCEYSCPKEEEANYGRLLPVDRVVFVVHGIGEAVWSRSDNGMASLFDATVALDSYFLKSRAEEIQRTAADAAGAEAKAKGYGRDGIGAAVEAAKANAKPPGRVMVLPVYWFDTIHGQDQDVQRDLGEVTLTSVPAVRNFSNGVVMDVLFYTTPVLQATILGQVAKSLNAAWRTLRAHNPQLQDSCVSVVGHSLGSVIGFDLLQAQREEGTVPLGVTSMDVAVNVPRLDFKPALFVACGSPLGMFLTIRGDRKTPDYKLPTCARFVNVFHPSDPVAYRVEPRFDPRLAQLEPEFVRLHDGGYRALVHLKLMHKDAMSTIRTTTRWWSDAISKVTILQSATAALPPSDTAAAAAADAGADNFTAASDAAATDREVPAAGEAVTVAAAAAGPQGENAEAVAAVAGAVAAAGAAAPAVGPEKAAVVAQRQNLTPEELEADLLQAISKMAINEGERVDYQLQESPLQSANQYVAALGAHGSYFFDNDFSRLLLELILRE